MCDGWADFMNRSAVLLLLLNFSCVALVRVNHFAPPGRGCFTRVPGSLLLKSKILHYSEVSSKSWPCANACPPRRAGVGYDRIENQLYSVMTLAQC
jgi:hypothetical protein